MIFKLKHISLLAIMVLVGTFCYGQVVPSKEEAKKISIYPNPVQDEFQLNNLSSIKFISINSITGREMIRFRVENDDKFSVSDLSKGIYIVRLFDHSNEPIKVLRMNKA